MRVCKIIYRVLPVLLLACAVPSAASGASGDVVSKIKDTGVISVGYRPASVPFSYLNNAGTPIGYSIDICRRIVSALAADLKLKHLTINFVQDTPATRIPLITNGTIALSCGSSTNNVQRERLVSFSPTIFITGERFVSLKRNNFKNLDDLKGKSVSSTAGSIDIKWLHETNVSKKLGMHVLPASTHPGAFLMVANGRAAAMFEDDVLLAGLVANSHHPDRWAISPKPFTVQPYGIIEPKGAKVFNRYVNDAVQKMMRDGTLAKLYAKWFTKPIPPSGINLNWPMSGKLKWAILHPTNSPNPSDYGQ